MPAILLFNNQTGILERFERSASDPMPYNTGGTLKVREFASGRDYPVIWTDIDTMRAYNQIRSGFGRPIRVARGFRRLPDPDYGSYINLTGKGMLIEPLAGTAQELLGAAKAADKVVKAELSGDGVYFDTRYSPCSADTEKRGLPNLERGDANNYVALLQDIINVVSGAGLAVDGRFGSATDRELRNIQERILLTGDGIVTLRDWESLLNMALGSPAW